MNKIILTILAFFPLIGFAQADWENPKGAIKDKEIVIEKNKQITLEPISRRFTSIVVEATPIDSSVINHMPKEIELEIAKVPVKLRPKTMKTEPLDKTNWGTFKAGYGSYVSPYLQADVASKRSDEYAMALHFRHFSSKNGPIDGSNSGLSNTDGYLSGKLFLNFATLAASVGAKIDKYNLYGYRGLNSTNILALSQRLTDYSIAVNLTDNDKNEEYFYSIKAGANFFNAKDLAWKESDLSADITSNYILSDNLTLNVLASIHGSKTKSSTSANDRLYYMLKPVGVYKYNDFDFEIGAGLFGTKDSINTYQHKFYITPHVVARYNLSSKQTISAGVKGDVTWKSATILFNENPYLGAATVVNNEVKPLDIFIESAGNIFPKVDYSISYHAAVYSQFGQFVNNVNSPQVFIVDYSTATNTVHQFAANVDFITNEQLKFKLYGNYFGYNFQDYQKVYHLPKVKLGLTTQFIIVDKLETELTFTYINGLYGLEIGTIEHIDVAINAILDLNLSANYRINKSFSVFAKMNNIIGNEYQYYYRYPSKGFQFLGGISLTL